MQFDLFSPRPAAPPAAVEPAPSAPSAEVVSVNRQPWIYRASYCTLATSHRPDLSDHDTEAALWAFVREQLRSTGRRWTGYRVDPRTGAWTALPYPQDLRLPSQGGRGARLDSQTASPPRPTLLGGPRLVLDTETTGRSYKGPRPAEIHQLGAVLYTADGEELTSWVARACPYRLQGGDILRSLAYSGTRPQDLKGHPRPEVMLARFLEWYRQQGSPVCVAFNRPFDEGMLVASGVTNLSWDDCLMQRARKALGLPKAPKLPDAAELLGVALQGRLHDALDDARLAGGVMVALARRQQGRVAA